MGKLAAVVGLALVVVACRKSAPVAAADRDAAVAPATPAAVAPAPDASPVDQRVATSRSFASFENDALDECLDMTLIAPPGTEQERVEKAADQKFKPEKGNVRLSSSCEEQFADRVVLASCLITKSEPREAGAVTVVIQAFYYNVRTAKDSDGYMRDCLQAGGKWTAAAKDDPEAARERLRQRAKSLQDLSDKLATPP